MIVLTHSLSTHFAYLNQESLLIYAKEAKKHSAFGHNFLMKSFFRKYLKEKCQKTNQHISLKLFKMYDL